MKMMASLLSLIAVLAAACAGADTKPITQVSVRNSTFAVVKELSPDELKTFERLWGDKSRVSEAFGVSGQELHFKLDITGGDDPGRWLYKTNGRTSELDIKLQPVFQVKDVQTFNKLIGAIE